MIEALAKQCKNTCMIIAGDFNVTTAIRKETEGLKNTPGEVDILHRLQNELGIFNAWQYLHPDAELPQTLRWSNKPAAPYHCDGIFLSKNLLPHLVSAEIIGTEEWATMSDHNPLVITLK